MVIITSAFVIIFIVSTIMITKDRSTMIEMIGNNISMQASIIGSNSATALLFDDRKTAQEILATLSSSPNIVAAALYDHNNRVFAVYAGDKANNEIISETPPRQGLYHGEGYLTSVSDIYLNEKLVGKALIGASLKEVNYILRKNALYTSALMLALFLGTFILSKLIQGLIVKPVVNLRTIMDDVSDKGDYSVRASKWNDDEIGQLVDGFNDMLLQIQRRDEGEKKLLSEKEKMLQDLHDGIGGIITNMKLLIDMAPAAPEEERQKICASLSELAKEGLSEIRGLMYSLDDSKNDWHLLASDLRRYGSGLTEPHGIGFDMEIFIDESCGKPSTLISMNLYRIFKEALNNAIKHAKAANISVMIDINAADLNFFIKDDGIGLQQDRGIGRGISNMKSRAKEIGGALSISSENGTSISLSAPLS